MHQWSPCSTFKDGRPVRFSVYRFAAYVRGGGWLLEVVQQERTIEIVATVAALDHLRGLAFQTLDALNEAIRREVEKIAAS